MGVARRLIVRTSSDDLTRYIQQYSSGWHWKPLAHLGEKDGLFLVELPDQFSMRQVIETSQNLNEMDWVRYAQPDLFFSHQLARGKPVYQMNSFSLADDIHLPFAWNFTLGESVSVAIIDDGFRLQHKSWEGVNIVPTFNSAAPSHPGADHGGLVAGVIFAHKYKNGNHGVAPEADFVPIQMAGGWSSQIIHAILQAIAAGADIINISWTLQYTTQPVQDVIEYYYYHGNEEKGVVFVAAAGNRDRHNHDDTEALANLPWVISVGFVDHANTVLVGDYGVKVDIAAPTMLPTPSPKSAEDFVRIAGSSGAAPVVSGVLALMASIDPTLTSQELRTLLIGTADPLLHDTTCCNVSTRFPYGLVNAEQAVSSVLAQRSDKKKSGYRPTGEVD
ncbi:S8 family peptidase [Gynuella sp.]|uniref:S8 family peptidase n=1 Tax=Gynuella sp. TaxID=2969146 RepID=UPI003D12FCB4